MSNDFSLLERARRVIAKHNQLTMARPTEDHLHNPCQGHFHPPLHIQRYEFIRTVLSRQCPPVRSVADLGSGHGSFICHLKKLPFLKTIITVDQDSSSVEQTCRTSQPQCHERLFGRPGCELTIFNFCGNVLQLDHRLANVDAFTCIELIEHLTLDQLKQFERIVFGHYGPALVLITTPNAEFNVIFDSRLLHANAVRHSDHQFEWTRSQFHDWCASIAQQHGYRFDIAGVGLPSAASTDVGFATQIVEFHRINETNAGGGRGRRRRAAEETNVDQTAFQLIAQHLYEHKKSDNCKLNEIDWNLFE